MNMRETAWRVFATELNASTLEIRATEEKSPSYVVSPLGAKINRVLVAGVLTEKENVGTPDDPRWRARIQDVNGSFYLSIGMYQPEALASMVDLETPCYVAAVGRVKAFTNADQRTYINVRPEHIVPISEAVRNEWVLETAKSTWKRLTNTKRALNAGDATVNDLIALGMSAFEAENICYALDNYPQMPDSAAYLKTIQSALRMLLPDREVDFGFPEDMSDIPDEISMEPGSPSQESSATKGQMEEIILNMLDELDTDGKGAPREELESRAEAEGINSIELEEITMSLMDKGLVYEPNLRYLKRI